MKFYNMIVESQVYTSESGFVRIRSQYDVPYERNDEYLKLINQENPRNPETLLEPESGMLLYANLDFEYNYHTEEYQKFSKDALELYKEYSFGPTSPPEHHTIKFLPSLNNFLLSGTILTENNSDFTNLYASSMDLYEADVRYSAFLTPHFVEPAPRLFSTAENKLSMEYFEHVSSSWAYLFAWYNAPLSSMRKDIMTDKIGNLKSFYPGVTHPEFINIDMARIYADTENKREMFPFFSKFVLTGVQKNGFCDLLVNSDLVEEFIDFLVMHRDFSTMISYYNNTPNISNGTYNQIEFQGEVWGYSLDTFMTHLANNHSGNIATFSANQTTCSYFESYLNSMLFRDALEKWMQTAPANQSLPVAFRLEKHGLSESEMGKLISVHYFFNYSDLLEFKYYDSTVSYHSYYSYNVRVINAMVLTNDQGVGYDMVFTEEPYYNDFVFILDSPPVAPDVELLTYRGIDFKNLILLNQMIDKEALVPIKILPDDDHAFTRQYNAQNIREGMPIIFESDSPTDFEIFKLMEKPVSYSDFASAEYKLIRTNNANSAAYEDNIVPNQHYYYIFRALDKNGFPSNPSPVYEFILNKEGETMYPKTRIIDFKKPDPPTQKTKTFKKYLKIGFSPRQYTLSEDEMNLIPTYPKEISPGISDDNIIGSNRVFKFRIRSKNTGKLIDINVTFKKNDVIQA